MLDILKIYQTLNHKKFFLLIITYLITNIITMIMILLRFVFNNTKYNLVEIEYIEK